MRQLSMTWTREEDEHDNCRSFYPCAIAIGIGIGIPFTSAGSLGPPGPPGPPAHGGLEFETDPTSFLLLEDGVSYLLLEA
jgi:hypothetical protein